MTTEFPNLHVLDHPLIQHKLSHMRDKGTSTRTFRTLLREIALLMGYEVTRNLPLENRRIETPMQAMDAPVLQGKKVAIVPILRAGNGMADGLMELMPGARVGHIGLVRDPETHKPTEYLVKLPEAASRTFILVDPMLATGHSAVHAVDVLNRHGVPDENILFLALVTVPEGMRTFNEKHPNVQVYVASLDERLDDHAYILPGLGDAGDRLFGTK
ncbi:MAG: uracil phosphoribosyltransferase [Caenispirillum bisanense]|nr:uracil phosphoribosyltransferase [Caenispirillum bisanense]MCA1975070.1 uracil phosphoribosyltransferase [Caenispirillum sp.]